VYAVQDLVQFDDDTQRPLFKPLIEQLQKTVTTEAWDTQGGMATIRGFDSTVSLVVRQTPAGHEAVAKFLADLRAKAPTP
jgi:general secretion pathway protein D